MMHVPAEHSREGSWSVWTTVRVDEAANTYVSREIVAAQDTRAEWQARFWSLFPDSSTAFEQLARGPQGIHVTLDLAGQAPVHVQSQYGGFDALKLHRLMKTPSEQRASQSSALELALATYERDWRLEEAGRKQVLLATLDRLPRPPAGYYWAPDYGGLIGAPVVTFRLWSHSFGYMPSAE